MKLFLIGCLILTASFLSAEPANNGANCVSPKEIDCGCGSQKKCNCSPQNCQCGENCKCEESCHCKANNEHK